MKINIKLFTRLVAALALLLTAGLKAFSQNYTDCDADINFSQYKTYDFRPGKNYYQGQKEKNTRALERKVNNSVAAELNKRGLTQSSVNPDLIVTHTYNTKQISQLEIKAPMYAGPVFYTSEGIWAGTWTNWWLRTEDVGTLTIDVKDNLTNKLVYQVYSIGDVKKPKKQQKEFNRIAEKGFMCFHR